MRLALVVLITACAAGMLAAPDPAHAQETGETRVKQSRPADGAPCCFIASIDVKSRTVTARETASGYTFKFTVSDKKLLASLKVGEKVWADFGGKKVRLKKHDSDPCCTILAVQVQSSGGVR